MLLTIGDSGEAVRSAQQALRELGFGIDADGLFGSKTEAAVKEFQRQNALNPDGIVEPQTLHSLGLDMDLGEGTEEENNITMHWRAFKTEIVRLVNQEWQRWHPDGIKKTETDADMFPVLQDYYLRGVQQTIEPEQLADPDWQDGHPWSAVFISWVMRMAGA